MRPRRASLFERVDGPVQTFAAMSDGESFEQALTLDAPAQRRRAPGSAPAQAPEPAAGAERSLSRPSPVSTAQPDPPRPARSVDPEPASVAVQRRRRPAAPPPHEPAPSRVPIARSHPAAFPEPAVVDRPAADRSAPIPAPALPGTLDERPSLPATTVVEPLPKTPPRAAPAAIEVRARPERPTRREQRRTRGLAQPEPAIHVSIGRVEVRAVAPPPPASNPTLAAPSGKRLDEYLRERDGAAR